MTIVTLTPHALTVCGRTFESAGLARCESFAETIGDVDGIKVNRRVYGEVTGLPEPVANTIYIVSRYVAEAVSGKRNDIYVVDETIRDSEGRIIGCNALAII